MNMNQLTTISRAGSSAVPARGAIEPDRRSDDRKRLVYRLVHVEHDGDLGLGRCRNISDSGMKLELTMPVTVGAQITVAFSAVHSFTGIVIWSKGRLCGVALDDRINYDIMLRQSAAETRARGFPGLRPSGHLWATLRVDGDTRETRVQELNQQGLKVAHDGRMKSNLQLSIRFGCGRERQGVVRSNKGNVADVILLEPFSVGELGSVTALADAAMRGWAHA
jgi:hypothetical protein